MFKDGTVDKIAEKYNAYNIPDGFNGNSIKQ